MHEPPPNLGVAWLSPALKVGVQTVAMPRRLYTTLALSAVASAAPLALNDRPPAFRASGAEVKRACRSNRIWGGTGC